MSILRTFYLLLAATLLLGQPALFAQIGMGGSPHPSAVLDLKSPNNNKAFYPPRLTSSQRQAIPDPQAGAFVYDTEKSTMFLFDGQDWLPLVTSDPTLLAPISRTSDDGVAGDNFGRSVSISGDYAIVGAYFKSTGSDPSQTRQGAAYIFVRSDNGWVQQQRLTANDGASNDLFGNSVAISGDYAVVGAQSKSIANPGQGAAYVFVRSGNNWNFQQRLMDIDGKINERFGEDVDISGEYIIVGTSNKTIDSKVAQGAAYMFVRSGSSWTQQVRLTANEGQASDFFGRAVALSADYAMVGAIGKDATNTNQGAVYMFKRAAGTWTQQQRLTISDGATDDFFGRSVAISGDYAIVGANGKSITETKQGAAYIFRQSDNTWTQQQRIILSDGKANDNFGWSVALSGNYAIVGAPQKVIDGTFQGASFVFRRTGSSWSALPPIPESNPGFISNGYSVGLNNGTFIIGGPDYQNAQGKVSFGTVN